MDQLKGAFNSFAGGNNQNQQHQQQPHGEGQQQPGGNFMGALNSFTGGNQQQHQQQPEGGQQHSGGSGLMGAFSSFTGGNQQHQQPHGEGQQQSSSGGGFLGGLGDKFNSAAGGGRESEKNEDYLDKGVDFVQEKFLGQGPQDNESAVEQAKDEQISDFIRDKYKSTTGKDFFIKDKETRFG